MPPTETASPIRVSSKSSEAFRWICSLTFTGELPCGRGWSQPLRPLTWAGSLAVRRL